MFAFEPNEKFIEWGNENEVCCFMLADEKNVISEVSENCEDICFISNDLLAISNNNKGRRVILEDLFECVD